MENYYHIRVTNADDKILRAIVEYIYERSEKFYACIEKSNQLHIHIACELTQITSHTLKQNCKKKWSFLDKTTWSVKQMRKSFDDNCCYISKLRNHGVDAIYKDLVKGCDKTPDEYHKLYWENNKKKTQQSTEKKYDAKPTDFNSYVLSEIHKRYPKRKWKLALTDLDDIGVVYSQCCAKSIKLMGVNRYKETVLGFLNHLCDDNSVQSYLQSMAFSDQSGIPLT